MGSETYYWRKQGNSSGLLCEPLEARQLLALNGIGDTLGEPILFFDGIQTASYDAGTGEYQLRAQALSYLTADLVEHEFFPFVALLEINLSIDNAGAIIGGTATSTDMQLAIDLNNSGAIDAGDELLLSGQIEPV